MHIAEVKRAIEEFFTRDGVQDIFELTYAYASWWDNVFFNRTLFIDYAGNQQSASADILLATTRSLLEKDRKKIACRRDMIEMYDTVDVRICKKMLDYVDLVLLFVREWVPCEVEKACPGRLAEHTDCFHEDELIEKDAELFDVPVHKNSREVARSFCVLSQALSSYGEVLAADEKLLYETCLQTIKTLPLWKEELCERYHEPSLLDAPIFDTLLARETYMQLFVLVFAFYGLEINVQVDERNSIYDGHKTLYIPSSSWYDTLSLRKVLRLIAHEIETHYIVLHNNQQLLGSMKWWFNLSREEWLAMFQEFLLTWRDISDIDMSSNLSLVLMWELYTGEDFLKFLNIYRKLHGFSARWYDRLLRLKRNYPLQWVGVQHKDVAYSRWIYQVRNYLINGWVYADLFLAKVDFEDIALLATQEYSNKQLLFPKQFALRMMYRFLAHGDSAQYDLLIGEATQKYPFIWEMLSSDLCVAQEEIYDEWFALVNRQ